MRESKAELTDRLRREGRFETFKKRREELKAEGIAASDAWDVAAAEFPPPPEQALHEQTSAFTKNEFRTIKKKPRIRIGQAIRWVFDNLEGDWVRPKDAPSAGAWSLRQWARSSTATRAEFYRIFAVRLLAVPGLDATIPAKLTKAQRRMLQGLEPDSV